MSRTGRSLRCISLVVFATIIAALPASARTPIHLWSQGFGSPDGDVANSAAVDMGGSVYVTGQFSGTLSLGGAPLVSAGGSDIFLAKYDADGSHQWSRRFGGTGNDEGMAVAVSEFTGELFLTGYFFASADLGGGPLSSAGGYDAFLAKYNPSTGAHIWSHAMGGPGPDSGYALDACGFTGLAVTGYFSQTAAFNGTTLVSAGDYDVFLAYGDSDGATYWATRLGGPGQDISFSIAMDADCDVYVAGAFDTVADFGGGNVSGAGWYDGFLVKYWDYGTLAWVQTQGGTGFDETTAVTVRGFGDVYATGLFEGSATIGGINLVSAGGYDAFLLKCGTGGWPIWNQRFGGAGYDAGYSLDTDPSNNVFMTGAFQGTSNYGGGNLVSLGDYDIHLSKYAPSGANVWSQRFGSYEQDLGKSVAVDYGGDVVVTGTYVGQQSFGGADLGYMGGLDLFVARFSGKPSEPLIQSIKDVGNDQGRQVLIKFEPSGYDAPAMPSSIVKYEAYRRIDSPPPSGTGSSNPSTSDGAMLAEGWTEVGTVDAHGESGYSIVVPTIGDSTIAFGPYNSTFRIRAATSGAYSFFDSPADSGYSLDNLAPGVPQNLAFNAGDLTWIKSSAADFDYFTVYGANVDAFSSATVVNYTVDPSLDVSGSPYVYYYVTATDFSGNEGKAAKVNTLSGAGGTPASYVLSLSSYPNPFNPRTAVAYTVPSRGTVTVAIYDTRGARIATLVDHEQRGPGAYRVDWDGRDDNGAVVASGVYFARIEHASGTRSKKMTLLK